jgi:hypothetical protein
VGTMFRGDFFYLFIFYYFYFAMLSSAGSMLVDLLAKVICVMREM